jgi:hypothetical protein
MTRIDHYLFDVGQIAIVRSLPREKPFLFPSIDIFSSRRSAEKDEKKSFGD